MEKTICVFLTEKTVKFSVQTAFHLSCFVSVTFLCSLYSSPGKKNGNDKYKELFVY